MDGMYCMVIVIYLKIIYVDRVIWCFFFFILLIVYCGYSFNVDCLLFGYWFFVCCLFLYLEVFLWFGGVCIWFVGYDNGGGVFWEVFIGWFLLLNK